MTDTSNGNNEDLKAKMREALDKKKAADPGVKHSDHDKGHAEEHGAAGGKRVHRRKSG